MHETSLLSSVVNLLKREAEKNNAVKIERVYLKLGKGPHDLEPDRVKEVFELVAKDSIAEGAELVMEQGPPDQEDEIVIEKFDAIINEPEDGNGSST